MSARLENTIEELDMLTGATIEKIWVRKSEYDDCVRIRVRFHDNLRVNGSTHGEFEVWQDEEGNGPGYLAFMGEGE